jgi:phage shock protein A
MKDIDIRNIQPVVERRTPEKSGVTEKPAGEAFQKELDTAVTRAKSPDSIEDRVRKVEQDVNQTSQQLNEVRNGMQSLVLRISQLRTGKSDT